MILFYKCFDIENSNTFCKCHIVKMWDLSQNDEPFANVLMHIIIYSTVYKKKCICICIGSAGL